MPEHAEIEAKPIAPHPAKGSVPFRRQLLLVLLLATLFVAGYLVGGYKLSILEKFVELRDTWRATLVSQPMLTMALFVAVYAALVAMSVPGASFGTLAGGLLFGWFIGGIASIVAATCGAAAVFLIARSAFGETLARQAGPHIARFRAGFQDNALSYLLFMRLTPVFPFFLTNIVPAVLGVPFRTFVAGTFFGIIPGTFTYASVGAGLDSILAAAKAGQATCRATASAALCPLKIDFATLVTFETKIAFGCLGLLALMPVAIKIWRQRQGKV